MEQLTNLARFLRARRKHHIAKRQATEAYDAMRTIERELVEEMEAKNTRQWKSFDESIKVHLRRYETCSVTKENEMQVREWLRETHGDDHNFDQAMLNKAAVVDWVKDAMEKGTLNETELPDFLGYKSGLSVVVSEVSF